MVPLPSQYDANVDYIEVITDLMQAGANVLMRLQGQGLVTSTKRTPSDLVTEADIASEKAILQHLSKVLPNDGWLSEESGFKPGTTGRTWVIDPLDGTVNYAAGVEDYGVIVGLLDGATPIAGGMLLPSLGLTYTAVRGMGAYVNGKKVSASKTSHLPSAVIDHSLSSVARDMSLQDRTLHLAMTQARGVRCSHSLRYLGRVVEGVYDGFIYHTLGPWDLVGPIVLLEEAGATVQQLNHQVLDWTPSVRLTSELYAVMGGNRELLEDITTRLAQQSRISSSANSQN